MTNAGFIHKPDPDSNDMAECGYCGLQLDGWEEDDIVEQEHLRRSPDCLFFHPERWNIVKKGRGRNKKEKVCFHDK